MFINRMRPIHPGEILREEFLEPLQMSIHKLAQALHISTNDVAELVAEKQSVSVDIALRLARYFNTTAQFWLNLQVAYDLRIAERKIGNQINAEISPLTKI